jgi:hypothetical protein
MKKHFYFIIIFFFYFINNYSQTDVNGFYKGLIKILNQEIEIEIEFIKNNDLLMGAMNIPSQGAQNIPLNNLKLEDKNIFFEIMEGPRKAVFSGEVNADSINGEFNQLSFKGSFIVYKSVKPVESNVAEQKDYIEEEVVFNNGDIKIAGTLSYPKTGNNFPAVILISGSGAQNRDSDIYGFKLFKVLSDYLNKNGIAVLRCDDRGVGGSSGNVEESTSEDFADDIVSAYKFLKTIKIINPRKIGLYGHSEGGIIAPIAISKLDDVAFAVLVAAPAVSGEEIIYKQVELIMRANNASEEEIKIALSNNKEIFNIIKAGGDKDTLKKVISKQVKDELDKMPDENKKELANNDLFIQSLVDSNLKIYYNNWFNFFLNYDPAPMLLNVNCPVILVFGGLDKQVDEEQNRKILENQLKSIGNMNVKSLRFDKANHLFQLANTGSPTEYAKLDKKYIDGFLEQITDWILNTVK